MLILSTTVYNYICAIYLIVRNVRFSAFRTNIFPHMIKLYVKYIQIHNFTIAQIKLCTGNSMSSHPAISPTSTDLSESWRVESSNPAIRYVQVLVCLVK